MRTRISTKLTYANVVATLALFLVISGGTALGVTYVVSSNSQVGPNTISGHNPPTGKHSNIITGSVNGTDLSANSVNSSKVTAGSLLGSDIHANTIMGSNLNLSDVASKLQIQTARGAAAPGDPPDVFYNHGNYQLAGTCVDEGGGFHAQVSLSVISGPAFVSINNNAGTKVTGSAGTVAQSASVLLTSGNATTKGGQFGADSIQFANHLSGHVLASADDDPTDFGGATPACIFTFEGVGQ